MRVLHLLGATGDHGGILAVLRNLQAAGSPFEIEHAVLVHESYQEKRSPPLNYRYSRHLVAESPRHGELFFRAAPALRELRQLLRKEHFDVLHGHSRGALPVALGISLLWRRPVVFTHHAYARRKGLYRWAARRRHLRFVALTPNMARYYGLSLETDALEIISACCADRFFTQPLAERRRPSETASLRLVGLGNIVPWKNWHLLLEALIRLPKTIRHRFEFHHYGPIPEAADCRAYAEKLRRLAEQAAPARCVFHGLSLNVEKPLREADWFVLPSTNEPCSVALIESLALGVPALASASGGNVDILAPDRTGVLFAPEDAADLARQLRRLLEGGLPLAEPEEIRDLVRERRAGAVAAQYRALYRQACWPGRD